MKKTLTVISLLAGAVGVYAQGQINWANYDTGTWSIGVYSANFSNPAAGQVVGNTTYDLPTGAATPAQMFPGSVKLGGTAQGAGAGLAGAYNGNNYEVGIYVASSPTALATALASGTPLAAAMIDTANGQGTAGYWTANPGDSATSAIYTPTAGAYGAVVYVELAAWYTGGNSAISSYAAAVAAGNAHGADGVSNPISLNTATSLPPDLSTSGLQSFDLIPGVVASPEPSTIALGVIGASTLLFRRRK